MPTETKELALGILAGEGALPHRLVQHCRDHHIPVCVVQFEGCDYAPFPDIPTLITKIEKVGAIFDFFHTHKVNSVVMIGNLQKPELSSLRPDWQGMKVMANLGKNYLKGDDNLLRALRSEIERHGFTVMGIDHYLQDLTIPARCLTQNIKADEALYRPAIEQALKHGAADKGQSILYHTDGTYSYETRAGTAALIRAEGRPGSVLIKMMKPQQDPDLDRPTVGLQTVQALHDQKCAGMVIQANAVFAIDRAAMIEYADDNGLFILGVEPHKAPSLYLIAGEESGDILGGRLLSAMQQSQDDFDFTLHGIGGDAMRAQGLRSLFPMTDLSVMGVFEILPRLPRLIKRITQTVADIIAKQPDIVVTIDAPDFAKRVVKRARPHCPNTKFIHYVAPTVWAWRPGRAKVMARLFDGLICLFPFEPPYFEKEGLKAAFCGHPIVETIPQGKTQQAMGTLQFEVSPRDSSFVLILPGSRKGEVKRMAPVFAETFRQMKAMNPDLQARIVALPHVKPIIDEEFYGMDIAYIDPQDRFETFQNAPFALATSGTVGLELAVAGCPHVIAYKMNPLTWWMLKRLATVKYAHLVNIMQGREVIPECLQGNCTPDMIMRRVISYDNPDLSTVRGHLTGADNTSPSTQAAAFVRSFKGDAINS